MSDDGLGFQLVIMPQNFVYGHSAAIVKIRRCHGDIAQGRRFKGSDTFKTFQIKKFLLAAGLGLSGRIEVAGVLPDATLAVELGLTDLKLTLGPPGDVL